jgi:hypothetical protein
MAVPNAPLEGAGDKVLFAIDDNGGTNRANLLKGYQHATQNSEAVADLGVYATSGRLKQGNRNLTSTTALVLTGASVPCQGVLVKAREANASDIWVGTSTVTADTTEATGGWRLRPGASVGVPCRNTQEVYIRTDSYSAGDGVEWIASID